MMPKLHANKVYTLMSVAPGNIPGNPRRRLYLLLLGVIFLSTFPATAQFNWGQTGLQGETLLNPTSLDFGPNGKLYVSQVDGIIYEYTIERNDAPPGNGVYTVSESKAITLVKNNVTNHNDDGTIEKTTQRQITGILATGTAQNPILYVASSDYRIGGKSSPGNDVNLDTNSGILSRLTWNGSTWIKVDLVRGLPRCEENHSTNGMDLFTRNGQSYLLLQQGGNTNQGAPSNNFAGSTEYFLAGAILIVNLTQLEQMETAAGGAYIDLRDPNTRFVYDLPTLNDPERPDIDNTHPSFPYTPGHPLYNATIDLGDPFGGNNGLNQAFSETGGPVQIFSPGYRNAYDVVVTQNGGIYTSDNGPNAGWGGPPVIKSNDGTIKGDHYNTSIDLGAGDFVTNDFNFSNGQTHGDQLHFVGSTSDADNSYYAGHPVPIRAFPSRAGVIKHQYNTELQTWEVGGSYSWGDLISGVSGYFQPSFSITDFPDDPRQAFYTTDDINNPQLRMLDIVNSSTNGICEYTASNFDNALQGNLLTASFNGSINRYTLTPDGNGLVEKNNSFLSGFGSQPLDIIAQGDNDIFPGTIWAATYGASNITIFEPGDFIECPLPSDPVYQPTADYDGDGFTNEDEIANGTDYCSAGSRPNDNDLDGISDLTDPDDDNDGIPDVLDNFALDPNNGLNTPLPIDYPFWNNDPGTGMFGLGFTGLMRDPSGNTDYLTQYDIENLSFGGAGGKATVDQVDSGTAREGNNTQHNAFQFGFQADITSTPFTIHGKIETPFNDEAVLPGQRYGMYLGTGDQDNYFEMSIDEGTTSGDTTLGISLILEVNGSVTITESFDIPGLESAPSVDLYLDIDPSAQTVRTAYSLNDGASTFLLGDLINLPSSFLDPSDTIGLATGIISTRLENSVPYIATWDFLNVTENQSEVLVADKEEIDFQQVIKTSGEVQVGLELQNAGSPSDPAITISEIRITNDAEGIFSYNYNLPVTLNPGGRLQLPVSATPSGEAGIKTGILEIIHNGLNSPLQLPLTITLTEPLVEIPYFRINAGGNDVLSTDSGPVWLANNTNGAFSSPEFSVSTGIVTNASFAYDSRDASVPGYIDEATYNALFSTERYDQESPPAMEYNIPVPSGDYSVNLYLGSSFFRTNLPGTRVFDILVDNIVVVNDFDPVVNFGYQVGGMLKIPVRVLNNVLNISFAHVVENPNLYAIEINQLIPTSGVFARATASVISGEAPLEVSFTGTDSFGANAITAYQWDFGDGTTSTEANPVHTFDQPGMYEVSLRVSDGNLFDTASLTISVEEATPVSDFTFFFNAGGPEVLFNNETFLADQNFTGGSTYINNAINAPELFTSERNALTSFSYAVPVNEGTYEVQLYFAEIFWGATGGGTGGAGSRVFDVLAEGQVVLDNLDIYAEAGGAEIPLIKTLEVPVNDGTLDLLFTVANGGVNRPKVSAIAVKGLDSGSEFPPLAITPIPDQLNSVGASPELSVAAEGGDPGANFTYAISGQPAGIDIEPTNGLIFGVVAAEALSGGPNNDGVHEVSITVSKPGSDDAIENFIWEIASREDRWTDKDEDESYTARHECSFVQAGDKFFLMGGRENATTTDIYDYATNTWTSLTDHAPFEFNHFQAVTWQDLIWVIGAFQTNDFPVETPATHIWILHPATGAWIQSTEIPENRRRGSAGLVVYNDKFYVVGGNTIGHDGGYVPWLDEYDPKTGIWTPLADAPHPRDHFSAVVVGENLYAVSGRLSGGNGGVFAPTVPEVDVYNFATQSWTTLSEAQNIPTPRAGAVVVNFENEILVAGGESLAQTAAFDITEIFNPASGSWRTGALLNHPRHGTQGIVSGHGVYVLGGSPNRGGGNQKNMEYYNGDSPQGTPVVASNLLTPEQITVALGSQITFDIISEGGTTGIHLEQIDFSSNPDSVFALENIPGVNTILPAGSGVSVTLTMEMSTSISEGVIRVTYNGGNTHLIPVFGTVPDNPPVAVASASQLEGEVPLEITFSAAESTSVSGFANQSWDFGDGNTAEGETVTHTYVSPGTYLAVLTVTDVFGLSDSDSLEVVVTDPVFPILQASPSIVDFGSVPLNSAGSSLRVTLINSDIQSDTSIDITSFEVLDDREELFAVDMEVPVTLEAGSSVTPVITLKPGIMPGAKQAEFRLYHTGDNSPLIIPLQVQLETPSDKVPVSRVDVGGKEVFTATDGGPDWEPLPFDGSFQNGYYSVDSGVNRNAALEFDNRTSSIPPYIDKPTFDRIYTTERVSEESGVLRFVFLVPNEAYQVNLYVSNGSVNEEVQDLILGVQTENTTQVSAYNLYKVLSPGTSGMLSFPVVIQDGELNLNLVRVQQDPYIHAIEILGPQGTTIGIPQLYAEDVDFLLYPNPSNDKVKLFLRDPNATIEVIYLHDMQGKQVRTYLKDREIQKDRESFEISVSGLQRGLYLVQILLDNGTTLETRLMIAPAE